MTANFAFPTSLLFPILNQCSSERLEQFKKRRDPLETKKKGKFYVDFSLIKQNEATFCLTKNNLFKKIKNIFLKDIFKKNYLSLFNYHYKNYLFFCN